MAAQQPQSREGRTVHDLLHANAETIVVRDDSKNTCDFHAGFGERLVAIGTTLEFMADWIGEIKSQLRNGGTSFDAMGDKIAVNREDIQVLRARLGIYAGIGGFVGAAVVTAVFKAVNLL